MPEKNSAQNRIICVVGPTSSGKSELAIKLASRFKGEIISVDSRQIYKGMDLGTGKVEGKWKRNVFLYKNIPHHLVDFVNPKRQYSAAQFQKQARKTIKEIIKQGKLPILCGGTAHWMDAIVFNQPIPEVKPNAKLRKKLEKKSTDELYLELKKMDPVRAVSIDPHNPRRLIRALEIVLTTGKPVPQLTTYSMQLPYSPFWIGINLSQEDLYAKIKKRLKKRLDQGMIKEVQKLRRQGLSWKRLESFGLEYKFVSLYLQKKLSYDEMFNELLLAIQHYTKRQITWWKRNKDIHWVKNNSDAQRLVKNFI